MAEDRRGESGWLRKDLSSARREVQEWPATVRDFLSKPAQPEQNEGGAVHPADQLNRIQPR